jgi:hypothetical protein
VGRQAPQWNDAERFTALFHVKRRLIAACLAFEQAVIADLGSKKKISLS